MCLPVLGSLWNIGNRDWKSERCIVVTSRSPDGLTGCVEAIGSILEGREASCEKWVTWKSDRACLPLVLVGGHH